MDTVVGTLIFVFVLIWAFRVETNTAKAKEALERIEKQLAELKKKEK